MVAHKQELRAKIMARFNKDLKPLEYKTCTTVLERLKVKDKKMYRHITRAGDAFQYAMFNYYEPLVNPEQVPDTYNYTK